VAVLDQQPFGGGAPFDQRGFEALRDRRAQLALVAGVDIDQTLELGRDRAGIDDFGRARGLIGRRQHGATGIAERTRCVTVAAPQGSRRGPRRAGAGKRDWKSCSTI
jgi:hypothetical protein